MIYLSLNPVDDTLRMSQAISELGILVVIAALFLVSFIAMASFLFRHINNTNKQVRNSQQTIISQNETITQLLERLAETSSIAAKIEQTRYNAEKIIAASFSQNVVNLLNGVSDIITHNNIKDHEYTLKRIASLVTINHNNRVKWLNAFKYNGVTLGSFVDSEALQQNKINIIKDFIYSDDRTMTRLLRNLESMYNEYSTSIKL